MKKLALPAVLAALILTGCSGGPADAESTPTPTATPTPTSPPNTASCEEFAKLTTTIADKINNSTGPAKTMWEGVRVSFDDAGLKATGIVQQRILAMTSDWPALYEVITGQYDDINSKFDAVARACKADGITISYAKFVSK